ncbi:hypothetical protein AMTRI_Chr05g71760 [Amborella trichopoda]
MLVISLNLKSSSTYQIIANLVMLMSCSSLHFNLDVTWMIPSLLSPAALFVLMFYGHFVEIFLDKALLPQSVIFKITDSLAFRDNHELKAFSTYISCHRLCTITYTGCIRRLHISHYRMPIYRCLQLLCNYS